MTVVSDSGFTYPYSSTSSSCSGVSGGNPNVTYIETKTTFNTTHIKQIQDTIKNNFTIKNYNGEQKQPDHCNVE